MTEPRNSSKPINFYSGADDTDGINFFVEDEDKPYATVSITSDGIAQGDGTEEPELGGGGGGISNIQDADDYLAPGSPASGQTLIWIEELGKFAQAKITDLVSGGSANRVLAFDDTPGATLPLKFVDEGLKRNRGEQGEFNGPITAPEVDAWEVDLSSGNWQSIIIDVDMASIVVSVSDDIPSGRSLFATVSIIQDEVGGHAIRFDAPTYIWTRGVTPNFDLAPNAVNIIELRSHDDGVTWYANLVNGEAVSASIDGGGREKFSSGSRSGAAELSLNDGNLHIVSVYGNITSVTITDTDFDAGYDTVLSVIVELNQASGGGWTIAFGSDWKWPGGVEPTWSTTLGSKDVVSAYSTDLGATWIATAALDMS